MNCFLVLVSVDTGSGVGADAAVTLVVVVGVTGVGSVVVGVVVFGVMTIGVDLEATTDVMTVVDVMSQESVVAGGLIMVVGVELSSSKNFFVVAKCRV